MAGNLRRQQGLAIYRLAKNCCQSQGQLVPIRNHRDSRRLRREEKMTERRHNRQMRILL